MHCRHQNLFLCQRRIMIIEKNPVSTSGSCKMQLDLTICIASKSVNSNPFMRSADVFLHFNEGHDVMQNSGV